MNYIQEIAYELYVQEWLEEHTTKEERIKTLKGYYNDVITYGYEESFGEWIFEYGYSNGIYVCFDEFFDNEYQDVDYMKQLLKYKSLIEVYLQDIV